MTISDFKLVVTFFATAAAAAKTESRIDLAALADRIRTKTAPTKEMLPWLKLATFGNVKTPLKPADDGSGRMTGGSLRYDANVLGITGVEADYDGEQMPFGEAVQRLTNAGVAALAYTSPSHTEDAPRWRILCPLSRPMEPARRRPILGRLNGLFGGVFSRESFTLSQAYYFGAVNRNPSHQVELVEGEAIDLRDDLDEIWIGPPGTERGAPDTGGDGEARDDAELVRRIMTGEELHPPLCALAGRYIARGMTRAAAAATLRGLLLAWSDAARDERWLHRFGQIPELVASAERKYCNETAEARRAVASVIGSMFRRCAPADEIRRSALAEAERHGLPPAVVHAIARSLARNETARHGGAPHA